MTNAIAYVIAGIVLAVLALDWAVFGWDLHIHLGRRFVDLIEYLSFWR